MEYTTVTGTSFDHHRGIYRTEPDGAGTRFTFRLEFSSRIPGLARLIKWPLEPINRRGFDNLARQLEERFRASQQRSHMERGAAREDRAA
jgi:hypothetical protein